MKVTKHITKVILLSLGFLAIFTLSFLTTLSISKLDINNATTVKNIPLPKAFIIQSGSMEPAIKTGSLVISYPSNSYTQGDIISFKPDTAASNIVTHRIGLKDYPNGVNNSPVYKTSGDANEDFDQEEISDANIIGKVMFSVPFVGYFAGFAKTPQGFILLVIIPATIIIYEELKSLKRQTKNQLSSSFERLNKKIRIKQSGFDMEASKYSTEPVIEKMGSPIPKITIIAPVLGAFLVIVAITGSYFLDKETSIGNTLGAAFSFDKQGSEPSSTPTPSPTPTPEPPSLLVLNELMINPTTSSPDWIEIYNPTISGVDLTGWSIENLTGNVATLSGLINPGQFLTLDVSNRLNNGGDNIKLLDNISVVIDQYIYASDPGIDISVGRKTDGVGGMEPCTLPTKGSLNFGSC